MRTIFSAWTWVALAIALAVVGAVVFVASNLWTSVGSSHITVIGWLAMAFGVLATFALGVGLMALVFLSSRQGYDEPPDRKDG